MAKRVHCWKKDSSLFILCCSDWMCQASKVYLCRYWWLWFITSTCSHLMVWYSFTACFPLLVNPPLCLLASVVSLVFSIYNLLLCIHTVHVDMLNTMDGWLLLYVSFRWLAHSTKVSESRCHSGQGRTVWRWVIIQTSISSGVWCGVLYCTDVWCGVCLCVCLCVLMCASICACMYSGTFLLRTPLGPRWLSFI